MIVVHTNRCRFRNRKTNRNRVFQSRVREIPLISHEYLLRINGWLETPIPLFYQRQSHRHRLERVRMYRDYRIMSFHWRVNTILISQSSPSTSHKSNWPKENSQIISHPYSRLCKSPPEPTDVLSIDSLYDSIKFSRSNPGNGNEGGWGKTPDVVVANAGVIGGSEDEKLIRMWSLLSLRNDHQGNHIPHLQTILP